MFVNILVIYLTKHYEITSYEAAFLSNFLGIQILSITDHVYFFGNPVLHLDIWL